MNEQLLRVSELKLSNHQVPIKSMKKDRKSIEIFKSHLINYLKDICIDPKESVEAL